MIRAYLANKQPDKAFPLIDELIPNQKSQIGADNPLLVQVFMPIAEDLLAGQHYVKAAPIIRECLDIRIKNDPEAWTTFRMQLLLGAALLGQKKYAEAAPNLLQGYEGMKAREAKIPPKVKEPRFREAIEQLVKLYEATGSAIEAAKWRKELEAIKVEKPKDKSKIPEKKPPD
jgi:hypothetical protein